MMERVFRFEPADWGTYRDALMAIENTCFHENLRETTSEKRRLLSRRGMLTLLYDAG